MENRYLFRAKRINNGEWVEGYYRHIPCLDEHYILPINPRNRMESYAVDTSTICQCTGLYDEDRKKIFEGDIVGFIDCTSTENGYSEHYCVGQVLWDQETASFQVTERLSAESYEVLDRGCKVLGNIFDNAELMEEWK